MRLPTAARAVCFSAIAVIGLCGVARDAFGSELGPANLLVSELNSFRLTEYTVTGALVQTFNIVPSSGGGTELLRDIVTSANGQVQIYNGTFTPVLTSLDPVSGSMSNRTFPQWSTVNNVSYGGIGVLGGFVYATDMMTFSGGEAQGIVRFDLNAGTALRFATSSGYQDLTIGGDGLLYGLIGSGGRIDVFDPASTALLRSIDLTGALSGVDLRGVAVDFDGTIYAAGWDGAVYAITSQGVVINSRPTGFLNLTDIDVDSSGRLVVGSRFGDVILTDTTLASQTSFTLASAEPLHVAWTRTIPEPTSLLLFGGGAGLILLLRRRSREG